MARTHSSGTCFASRTARPMHGWRPGSPAAPPTIAQWLDGNGVRLQDPASGVMPCSRRTAFFLGGGKAMINALYATATKLGVAVGCDSEVVELAFGDDRGCEAGIAHGGS